LSETSRRIANVLANTRIMKMSSAISSSSDEEGESSLHRSHDQSISSLDTDADESEHENSYNNNNNNNNGKPTTKSRRLLKTRKTSFSSLNNNYTPPISRIYMRKDDSQPQSSSNDDEQKEITIIHDEPTSNNNNNNNNTNSRRLKTFPSKKRDQMLTAATTTTTDDDTTKYHHHRYHPLDSFHSNHRHAQTESARSASTISTTNPFSLNRKSNRFQIKSIRKSQQQHVLVANATAAKSSNDDDCSQPVPRPKFALRHPLAARKHTNTPTTDGETSTTNTDSIVNGAVSALKTAENGYPRVRFHVPQSKKTESAAEEEKSVTTTSSLPTPAPPSSTASAQGEVSKQTDFINQK